MICATVTAHASNSYDPSNNKLTSTDAAQKSTVLIYKGETVSTSDDIVYVDQSTTAFDASTTFLLKANPDGGLYTVKFGGDGETTATSSTFYIGMQEASGDVELTKIDGVDGYAEVDGKFNIGFKGNVTIADYKSVIIKKSNGTYLGCDMPIESLSGDGSIEVGIQINGVESQDAISNVWLSTRTIVDGTLSK